MGGAPASPDQTGPSPADEARVRELAASIDLSSSLGVTEFAQARRRDVARTVDSALEVLSQSGASSAANAAEALLKDLAPAEEPPRRGLLDRLRRSAPSRQTPDAQWLSRAETALKLRQVALIKERCVLDKLIQEAGSEVHDLDLAAQAARLRADTEPEHAERLLQKADQLGLSRLAAAQALSALTLVRQAGAASEQAIAGVVAHTLPVWRKILERGDKPLAADANVQALASAEKDAAGASADAGSRLYTARSGTGA